MPPTQRQLFSTIWPPLGTSRSRIEGAGRGEKQADGRSVGRTGNGYTDWLVGRPAGGDRESTYLAAIDRPDWPRGRCRKNTEWPQLPRRRDESEQ